MEYLDKHPLQLNEEQRARYKEMVDEEIRNGHLSEAQREARLRELEIGGLAVTRDWAERIAVEESTKAIRIPGDPDVFEQLMNAETAEVVIEICKDAPNWPTSSLGFLPFHLEQHAEEFIAAKNDRRFPRSNRPTNRLKQFWFLSRALAGAVFGVKTRTAINLVGSKTPDQIFDESRFGKPARRQRKVKRRP